MEPDDAVGPRGDARVVGHEHDRQPALAAGLGQEVEDLGAGLGVQVARRLVGEDQGWVVGERTHDGGALLLAAAELVGPVVDPVPEAHLLEERAPPRQRVVAGHAVEEEREGRVLGRREGGEEVEELEHEAQVAPAESGQGVVRHGAQVLAQDADRARGGEVERANHVEERRLPGARRPGDRQHLARLDGEVHAAQRVDLDPRLLVALRDLLEDDDGSSLEQQTAWRW